MKNGLAESRNEKHFFNVREAAAYIIVNPLTMYRLAKVPAKDGGPPSRRFGKTIRFPIQKFIAWAEKED